MTLAVFANPHTAHCQPSPVDELAVAVEAQLTVGADSCTRGRRGVDELDRGRR